MKGTALVPYERQKIVSVKKETAFGDEIFLFSIMRLLFLRLTALLV